MEEITAALVKNLLPRRRQDGHKGSFGRVYVYGGPTLWRRPGAPAPWPTRLRRTTASFWSGCPPAAQFS